MAGHSGLDGLSESTKSLVAAGKQGQASSDLTVRGCRSLAHIKKCHYPQGDDSKDGDVGAKQEANGLKGFTDF
jgi:hypothetical protein